MERNLIYALAGGLVAGFLAGYAVAGGFSSPEAAPVLSTAAPVALAPSLGGGMPTGGGMPSGPVLPSAEVQARISRAEAAVLADPKNHDAWISLGNDYFDIHQAKKSVDAYSKALAIQPNDPNVLTDQGVMFRELQKFDQAVANFQKASKLDPAHVQSLFNLGVVYSSDLNKPDEAAKAWNRVITVAPNSDQARQARQMLSTLKK
ncbi:MAG: tetratricopeptide repeat protein [Holophagaceae bacterium]|nr:tetratricopeptide repeat protein [Holophagaceae bacterium]